MNLQAILNDIKTLPPDKQEEVVDFIAFLRTRLGIQKGQPPASRSVVESKEFFGMWADREDMRDSTSWVRELRTTEWENRSA